MSVIIRKDWSRLYHDYLNKQKSTSRNNCLSFFEIYSFFLPNTNRKKKFRIVRHIARCKACKEGFDWILDLDRQAANLGKELSRVDSIKIQRRGPASIIRIKKMSSKIWKSAIFIPSTILAILIILVLIKLPSLDQTEKIYRNYSPPNIKIINPTSEEMLSKNNLVFRWSRFISGKFYILELYDKELMMIWQSPSLLESTFRLPESILIKLKLFQKYYWSITCVTKNDRIIESALSSFKLTN